MRQIMDCQEFKRLIDSYLGDELLVETNHDVLRHLENCRDCREQLAAARVLRGRLRDAFLAMPEVQISDTFTAKLTLDLRNTALQPGLLERLTSVSGFGGLRVAVAGFACLLIVLVGLFLMVKAPNRSVSVKANNGIDERSTVIEANKTRLADAVAAAWKDLSAEAVGDHKNCAVKFNLAEHPISLDEAAKKFGAVNKDIDKAVFEAAKTAFDDKPASRIELLEAHFCVYAGRPFTHIVLRRNGKLISVIVTDTDLPAETEAPVTDHTDGALNGAGFSIGRHAFFVVSEMDVADNAQIARAIYPAMRRHIETAGA